MFFCPWNTWGGRNVKELERCQASALGCCSHHMHFKTPALHFQVKHQQLKTMWVKTYWTVLQMMVT